MQTMSTLYLACSNCKEKKSTKMCSGCNLSRYCSRDCQKAHWKIHKEECEFTQKHDFKNSKNTKKYKKEVKHLSSYQAFGHALIYVDDIIKKNRTKYKRAELLKLKLEFLPTFEKICLKKVNLGDLKLSKAARGIRIKCFVPHNLPVQFSDEKASASERIRYRVLIDGVHRESCIRVADHNGKKMTIEKFYDNNMIMQGFSEGLNRNKHAWSSKEFLLGKLIMILDPTPLDENGVLVTTGRLLGA